MIGSSVVPGLPNRCVMPSSLSNARNAERPVMRFIYFLPFPRPLPTGYWHHDRSETMRSRKRGHGCPARRKAMRDSTSRADRFSSKHPVAIAAFLLFRALPDHAGKALQRHQRLAGIGPFLQLLDRDVIERLPAGAPHKQRARDVDHMRRPRAFVNERRPAARAEAARGFCCAFLVAGDVGLALGDAQTLAPASDIRRIGRAMRAPARGRMIVPGPARRYIDLEADAAAQALAVGRLAQRNRFWLLYGLWLFREHLDSSRRLQCAVDRI